MYPRAFACNDTFRAENYAVLFFIGKLRKRECDFFLRVLANGFLSPTGEHLVRVVMMEMMFVRVIVVVTTTIGIMAFMVVMMLVMMFMLVF